ncbi:MAG: PAS domain S-box protein [Nitrospina sp.]|jgi:PAS domain S-box-containing protein|nr:PAS domain S-box protein [Nitrospina sp.]
MAVSIQQDSLPNKPKRTRISLLLFFALIIVTALTVGGFGVWSVEKQMKENLATQLELVLSGNIESLRIWAKGTKLDARVLASQPEVHQSLISLLEMAQSDAINADVLRYSVELSWLRNNLGAACKTYGFVGFVIFDNTAMAVGASLDQPIGTRDMVNRSDFYYRSLQGETVISQPFPGEINLPNDEGILSGNLATMFASTPIQNDSGEIVGVLAFRLRPEKEFSHILSISRFGETGETYAFNENGVLVSNSRFDPQLISLGLLQPGTKSIFNIQVRDPGRNLTIYKLRPDEDSSQWPLTVMASQAVQKENGTQVSGYNDYRGTPVVGAWAWVPEIDIGLTTEVDVAEAFRPLKTLMTWFLLLFGLLIVFGATAYSLRSRYAQSQQQTLENEEQLSSFINNTFDSIIRIDTCGIIQSVNPAVEKQFGYASNELLGQNVNMLMPQPYKREHDGYLQKYLRTGKKHILSMVREVTAMRKDKSTIPMELSVTESVVNGKNSLIGIIRDISERKEAETELLHAYSKLEERIKERTQELWESKNLAEKNNKAKSEFLSRMSHELRTPMNAILGFAQLMKESKKDPLPKAHQNRVSQILNAGNHLLELINEVLDLARIESGKITVSLEPICLAELIEEVLTVAHPLSEKFDIKLIDQITKNKDVYVLADKTRLKQVFLNLISNGIKYNRKGGSVTLSLNHKDSSGLRIDIVDTGMGIPEEKLNSLFEPFDRLGAEETDIEGTGIGMAISKKLIEVMNGSIGVESTPGEGSTFFVSLPTCPKQLDKVEPRNIFTLTKKEVADKHEVRLFTLLYIEDNPANLQLVDDILSDYPEIKLVSATHAKMGIDMALALKPDLILMDINLPDIDGVEAFKRLKNFEETHEVPVIAMSANAMQKDIDRAMAEGFKTYITKPVDIIRFRNIIEEELKSATTS